MNTFPKHFLHFPKHPKKIWRFEGVLMTLLDDFLTTSSSSQALLLLVNHLALPLALQAQWPGPTAPHGSAPKHRDRMPMRGRCRIATDVEIWIAKPGMPSTWKILPRPRIGCCGTPDSGGHSGAGRCHRSNSVWQLSHPFGLRSQYVTVLHSAFVRKNHTFEYCVLCVFTLYTFYNLQHLVSVVCELGSLFSKQNKQSPRWQLLQFFPSFSSLAAGITEVHFFFLGNSAFKVVRDGRNRNRRGEIGVKWVKVSWFQILWRRAGSAQDFFEETKLWIFSCDLEVFTSQRLKHCFLQSTLCVWRPGLTTWVEPSKPCNVGQPCQWLSMVRIANFTA